MLGKLRSLLGRPARARLVFSTDPGGARPLPLDAPLSGRPVLLQFGGRGIQNPGRGGRGPVGPAERRILPAR